MVRNAAERRRVHRAPVRELLKRTLHHRFHRGEHVVLRHEAHLDVQLVEHQRPVRPARLVAEAGCYLEIPVEPGHHRQLLELLRRLRQGVELAGVQPGRHQKVPRALRRAGRQYRRLELVEPERDHPPPDAVDDPGPQDHVPLQLLPPQVQEAVAEAHILRIRVLAHDLERQHVGRGLHHQVRDAHLDLARRQLRVHCRRLPRHHLPGHGDHALEPHRLGRRKRGTPRRQHTLRPPVMVPQVDEQQPAMVALAVYPAGQTHGLPGVGGA